MKSFSVAVFATFALAAVGFAQNQVGPGSVKLGKVLPSVVKTPEYQIVGGENKRFKNRDWLELEVEYGTVPDEIDELTFKYSVLLQGFDGPHLLDGEVTYVNIPKDREHYAVMYIPPRALEKISGGKPLSPASIDNVWVEVTHSGQVLDKPAAFKPGAVPNLPHANGLILTKDQTPFAPLYFDRYEAQKPATR